VISWPSSRIGTIQIPFEIARQEIVAYGLRNGLTMELMLSLTDPAEILALWDSAKADRG
jgi:hypothetical protein